MVLQFSLWFLVFDVFFFKNDGKAKDILKNQDDIFQAKDAEDNSATDESFKNSVIVIFWLCFVCIILLFIYKPKKIWF